MFSRTQSVSKEGEIELCLLVSERESNREEEIHLFWENGKVLFDQIHILAFQLWNDVVQKMIEFLQHGMKSIADGLPSREFGANVVDIASDSHEIDQVGLLGNQKRGVPWAGSWKRK